MLSKEIFNGIHFLWIHFFFLILFIIPLLMVLSRLLLLAGPIGKKFADLWPRIASAANAII